MHSNITSPFTKQLNIDLQVIICGLIIHFPQVLLFRLGFTIRGMSLCHHTQNFYEMYYENHNTVHIEGRRVKECLESRSEPKTLGTHQPGHNV